MMIKQHLENDPANDHQKGDDSIMITVDDDVMNHGESMEAEGSGNGRSDAHQDEGGHTAQTVGTTLTEPSGAPDDALADDQSIMAKSITPRSSKAGKAMRQREADHQQHRKTIKARRASSADDRNDPKTVEPRVKSVGHVSGLTLTSTENSGQKRPAPTNTLDEPVQSHVSGTTLPKANYSQRVGALSRPQCRTDVSHTMGRASGLTVSNNLEKNRSDVSHGRSAMPCIA